MIFILKILFFFQRHRIQFPFNEKKKKMNILIKSFLLFPLEKCVEQRVLVSATCVGNDGRSCPLLHGSLGPKLFSALQAGRTKLQLFLLHSDCITWANSLIVGLDFKVDQETFKVLSKTRYSSVSLKKLHIRLKDSQRFGELLPLVQQHCINVERLEVCSVRGGNVELPNLLAPLSSSLSSRLRSLSIINIAVPDFKRIQNFTYLEELSITNAPLSEDELCCLAALEDLRRLELVEVVGRRYSSTQLTGSFLDQVCPSLIKLKSLKILGLPCRSLFKASGIKHLSRSLEELCLAGCAGDSLITVQGYEDWEEFPRLARLTLSFIHFSPDIEDANIKLKNAAFPALTKISLSNSYAFGFYTKILQGCQRDSTIPLKLLYLENFVYHKDFVDEFLKTPLKELISMHCDYRSSGSQGMREVPYDFGNGAAWGADKIITQTLKHFKLKSCCAIKSLSFLKNCHRLETISVDPLPRSQTTNSKTANGGENESGVRRERQLNSNGDDSTEDD
jgi:hypothetical protein